MTNHVVKIANFRCFNVVMAIYGSTSPHTLLHPIPFILVANIHFASTANLPYYSYIKLFLKYDVILCGKIAVVHRTYIRKGISAKHD